MTRPSATLARFILTLVAGVFAAQAQQAPAGVIRNTPPPGPTDGVSRQGAGVVFAPDGTPLVVAQDPFAGGAAPAPSPRANQRAANPQQAPQPLPAEEKVTFAQDPSSQFAASPDGMTVMRVAPQASRQVAQPQSAPSETEMLMNATAETLRQTQSTRAEALRMGGNTTRNDGLDVDPEGALIAAQIDPRTGKPRRRASQIAKASGLVMIPAGTMLTIRSVTRTQTQLGGTMLGVIEYDVLNSQMDAIALPKGTKVLAAIQQVGGAAQDRAAFIIRQLVDPNGDQTQLLIPELATNSIGMSGVGTGDGATLNRHLGQKIGGAFAWGLLSAMTGQNSVNSANPKSTFSDTLRQNVSGSFGQVGQTYLQQAMDIKTDIEVPENTSMRVILSSPIYLKAWKVLRPF